MTTSFDDHATLGSIAARLAPRGLGMPAGTRTSAPRLDHAQIALRGSTLSKDERRELELAGATFAHALAPADSREGAGSEDVVASVRVDALESLARTSGAARALLAAHANATRRAGVPTLMGIVNVTPDSFSDGGLYLDPARAIEHGLALERAGARILDVGGESTRPGSQPVPAADELARVIPVIRGLAQRSTATISVDTTKAIVAREAILAGARIVNDVSAGRFDDAMLGAVAESGARFVLMHMQGTPATMQSDPRYGDPVADVLAFLRARARACADAGIDPEALVVDPGIGFGKTVEHNLELVARANELRSLGFPVCLGVSRKSFIAALWSAASRGAACTAPRADDRVGGTAAALAIGAHAGAEILRVHDVAVMAQAACVAAALAGRATPGDERAAARGDRASSGGERASPGGDRASSGGDRASSGGDRASSGGDRASSGGDRASSGGDRASPAADRGAHARKDRG